MDKKHYEKKLYTEFVRRFPNSEGQWKLVSTGETCTATETTDIEDCPMFTIMIDGEGPLMSIDFDNEIFVKLDDEGDPLA
jgi:hypothetical protein